MYDHFFHFFSTVYSNKVANSRYMYTRSAGWRLAAGASPPAAQPQATVLCWLALIPSSVQSCLHTLPARSKAASHPVQPPLSQPPWHFCRLHPLRHCQLSELGSLCLTVECLTGVLSLPSFPLGCPSLVAGRAWSSSQELSLGTPPISLTHSTIYVACTAMHRTAVFILVVPM